MPNKFKLESLLTEREKCPLCYSGVLYQFTDTQAFYYKGKLRHTLFYYSSCDNCYSDITTQLQDEVNNLNLNLEKSCH